MCGRSERGIRGSNLWLIGICTAGTCQCTSSTISRSSSYVMVVVEYATGTTLGKPEPGTTASGDLDSYGPT